MLVQVTFIFVNINFNCAIMTIEAVTSTSNDKRQSVSNVTENTSRSHNCVPFLSIIMADFSEHVQRDEFSTSTWILAIIVLFVIMCCITEIVYFAVH